MALSFTSLRLSFWRTSVVTSVAWTTLLRWPVRTRWPISFKFLNGDQKVHKLLFKFCVLLILFNLHLFHLLIYLVELRSIKYHNRSSTRHSFASGVSGSHERFSMDFFHSSLFALVILRAILNRASLISLQSFSKSVFVISMLWLCP